MSKFKHLLKLLLPIIVWASVFIVIVLILGWALSGLAEEVDQYIRSLINEAG